MCFRVYRTQLVATSSRSPDVLALPDPRAREGIPIQPIPHPEAAHRDRARALPHRASDQDMVPEPTHESQEGEATDTRAERTRSNDVVVVDLDRFQFFVDFLALAAVGIGGRRKQPAANVADVDLEPPRSSAPPPAAAAATSPDGRGRPVAASARMRRVCCGLGPRRAVSHRPSKLLNVFSTSGTGASLPDAALYVNRTSRTQNAIYRIENDRTNRIPFPQSTSEKYTRTAAGNSSIYGTRGACVFSSSVWLSVVASDSIWRCEEDPHSTSSYAYSLYARLCIFIVSWRTGFLCQDSSSACT